MKKFTFDFRKYFALIVLIVLLIIFGIFTKTFFTVNNLVSTVTTISINGLLAMGMTFCIITGGFDLSMGTGMSFCMTILGHAIMKWGCSPAVGVVICLLTGLILGAANGLMITKMKIPPFVATLGTMKICEGLAIVISGAQPYYLTEYQGFAKLATGTQIGSLIGLDKMPNCVFFFIVVLVITQFILSKSIFGRYVFAIGSNEEAVNLSGIKADKYKTFVYMVAGFFTALTGVVMTSRLASAQPTLGGGYEMNAVAATVLGGTPLTGGEGGVAKSVVGVATLTVLLNGMRMLGLNQTWQQVVTGIVVILAVYMDTFKNKKKIKVVA